MTTRESKMLSLVESCEGYEQAVRLLLSTVERQQVSMAAEGLETPESAAATQRLLGALETAIEAAAALDRTGE
jgi:hypothetical protein